MEPSNEKKRRGRKAKSIQELPNAENIQTDELQEKAAPKKRGRKPKGGKVVSQSCNTDISIENKTNIILHLKCSKNDIINTEINNYESYNFNNNKASELFFLNINDVKSESNNKSNDYNCQESSANITNDNTNNDNKLIYQKLEKLSNSLHMDNLCNKKSACFYCTCDFDNQPIYIPKFKLNNIYHVYGCFCSPECACASLMNDKNIDSTVRFERYYLLNYIYSKIFNYEKNIKPAPCPFYTLNKFYGSLSIQEYRKLLKNERLLLVVDKPLIRSMPELHDDSDDYLLNNHGIPSGMQKYIPQKQSKCISKNDIVNENFNIKI